MGLLVLLLLLVLLTWLGLGVLLGIPVWLALVPAVGFLWGWFWRKSLRRFLVIEILLTFVGMLVWRAMLTPKHDRTWSQESEFLAVPTRNGNELTVENVRNFAWEPDGSFVPSWESRRYDLAKLRSLDVWVHPLGGSPLVSHNMLSFGFGDDHLVISVEARRESHEKFGLVHGQTTVR